MKSKNSIFILIYYLIAFTVGGFLIKKYLILVNNNASYISKNEEIPSLIISQEKI